MQNAALTIGLFANNRLTTDMATQTRGKLEMQFIPLSLNGDGAVIHSQTHRTMLPGGMALARKP